MSILTIFKGRKGNAGEDGKDGSGVSGIRYSLLGNSLSDVLYNNKPDKGDSGLTWTRAEEALVVDRYDRNIWIEGSTITNSCLYSNDPTQWADTPNYWSINATGQTDPFGGSTATELLLDSDTVPSSNVIGLAVDSVVNSALYTISFWVYVTSGTIPSININFGDNDTTVVDDFTLGYQKVTVQIDNAGSGSSLFISPQGLSGATIIIFGVMAQKGRTASQYIETTNSPVTIPNPNTSIRSNDLGFLIEESKQNEIKNTEDLSAPSWIITGGGSVSNYESEDPFGNTNLPIQLSFTGETNVTLTGEGTFINSQVYSVSVYVTVISGSVDAMTASVAGGNPVAFESLPVSGFIRVDVKCTSAGVGGLTINITSSGGNAVVALTGWQVEKNNLTSYIRNANALNTRSFDNVQMPYKFNAPYTPDPWSAQFSHNSIPIDNEIKYLFNNGLSGDDEFSARFVNDAFLLRMGGQQLNISDITASNHVGITFDGQKMIIYKDGENSGEFNFNTFSVENISSTLYIGSDSTNENSINAYISTLSFWQELLTADEMKMLAKRAL